MSADPDLPQQQQGGDPGGGVDPQDPGQGGPDPGLGANQNGGNGNGPTGVMSLAEYVKLLNQYGWNVMRLAKQYLGARRGTENTELILAIMSYRVGWPQIPQGHAKAGEYGLPVVTKLLGLDGAVVQEPVEHPASAAGFPDDFVCVDEDMLVATFDARLLAFLPQEVREKLLIAEEGVADDLVSLANADPVQGHWRMRSIIWVDVATWLWSTGALSFEKKVLLSLGMNVFEKTLDRDLVHKQLETTLTWASPLSSAQTFALRIAALCTIGMGYPTNPDPLFPQAVDSTGRHQHPVHWVLRGIWDAEITGWGVLPNGQNGSDELTKLKRRMIINPLRKMADAFYLNWQQFEAQQERLSHKAVSDMFSLAGKTALGKHTLTEAQYKTLRDFWMRKADEVVVADLTRQELHGDLTRTAVLKAVREGLFGTYANWPDEVTCVEVHEWVRRADHCQLRPILATYRALPNTLIGKDDRREAYQKKIWSLYEGGKISQQGLEWGLKQLGIWSSGDDPASTAAAGGLGVRLVWRVLAVLLLGVGIRVLFLDTLGIVRFAIGVAALSGAFLTALLGGVRRRSLLRGIIDTVDLHFDDFLVRGFTLGLLEATWAVIAVNVAIKTGLVQEACSFAYIGAIVVGWLFAGKVIRRMLLESSLEVNQVLGLVLLLLGLVLAITGVPIVPDLRGLFPSLDDGLPAPQGEVPDWWLQTPTPTP